MKRKYFLSSILIILVMLSACKKQSVSTDNEFHLSTAVNELQEEIEQNLRIDAKVHNPKSEKYANYRANITFYEDKELMKSIFFENSENLEFPETDGLLIKASDGLFHSYVTILYLTTQYQKIYEKVLLNASQPCYENPIDFGDAPISDELSNMTKKEALQEVEELKLALSLPLEEIPSVCNALNWDTFQYIVENGEMHSYSEEEINWEIEQDEGIYYMGYRYLFEDEYVMNGNYSSSSNVGNSGSEKGSYLTVCVNSKGIQYLSTVMNYEETEQVGEPENIVGLDTVVEQIKEYYKNTIISNALTVKNIEFCYVPRLYETGVASCEMIPAWVVYVESEPSKYGLISGELIKINAITGEIM